MRKVALRIGIEMIDQLRSVKLSICLLIATLTLVMGVVPFGYLYYEVRYGWLQLILAAALAVTLTLAVRDINAMTAGKQKRDIRWTRTIVVLMACSGWASLAASYWADQIVLAFVFMVGVTLWAALLVAHITTMLRIDAYYSRYGQ